jgi:hypothetical protein
MTSLFFGKKKEEKPKDPKDSKKDGPPPLKEEKSSGSQDWSKVKVSAKDSLVKEGPKEKKEKPEKKEKKDKDKKPEDEIPEDSILNALFMALLVSLLSILVLICGRTPSILPRRSARR